MQISTTLEKNYLPKKYAKYAPDKNKVLGTPITSMPLTISDIPAGTKSLALIMFDDDAIPVSGFSWIHWTAIITDPTITDIPENVSQLNPDYLIQGKNSQAGLLAHSDLKEISERYTGPEPPNRDHEYQIDLVALDIVPELSEGFWLNDLKRIIASHEISRASLKFWSEK